MRLLLKELMLKTILSPGLIFGLFITIAMPFLIVPTYGDSPDSGTMLQTLGAIFSTGLSISIIGGWGISFSNIKNSNVTKRLLVSKYSIWNLVAVSLIPFAMTIFLIVAAFLLTILMLSNVMGIMQISIGNGEFEPFLFSSIAWKSFIASIFMNIILSMGITMLGLFLFKSRTNYLSYAWLFIIIGLLFGGATMPIFILRGEDAQDALKWIAAFSPQSYINFFTADAFNNQVVEFDWGSTETMKNILVVSILGTSTLLAGLYGVKKWS